MKNVIFKITMSLLIVLLINAVFSVSANFSPIINYLVSLDGLKTWKSSLLLTAHDTLIILVLYAALIAFGQKLKPELLAWSDLIIIQAPIAVIVFYQNIILSELTDLTPYTVSKIFTTITIMFGLLFTFFIFQQIASTSKNDRTKSRN